MSTDTCAEAMMARDFQSARQPALAKVLRFANVNIEKQMQKLQPNNNNNNNKKPKQKPKKASQKKTGLFCSLPSF